MSLLGRPSLSVTEAGEPARLALSADGSTLFEQGGEMGRLLARVEWASSPLGPVSEWSAALRTMVGMVLRNRSPLVLWWGPEFVQIYNDAYSPILASEHPRSLGQPAARCSPEFWDVVRPLIEAPYRGEAATWRDRLSLFANRKGFLEETHLKVAYSPVPDEAALGTGIGGVFGTVVEITAEVISARQLETLRVLARHGSEGATGATACARAASALTCNPLDFPCTLFYLLNADGKTAQLVGSTGFDDTLLADAPRTLGLDEESDTYWPINRLLRASMLRAVRERHAVVVSDVAAMELPRGAWHQPPRELVVLPLVSPEQPDAYGVLLVGVNPHRELNAAYLAFLDQTADQVTQRIGNARAYQQERARAKRLAELDLAKTSFFGDVSHELRTPLTLLLGPLQELRAELATSSAARERLDTIQRNALKLLKLINTLLNFSRLEAGRIDAEYVATNLSALTCDLALSFRSLVERAGLKLVVDCPPLPEPVYVDRDMWEKIVLNLLSNAYKFTFDGSIHVRLRALEGEVELVVSDTGIGVAELELPRLFERFHRVEGSHSRSQEGSGIGLSLVRELVRMHAGEVSVTSELGKGTRFVVRIPRGSAHLAKERIKGAVSGSTLEAHAEAFLTEARDWGFPVRSSRPPSAEPSADAAVEATQRVLYADDNADMRAYVTRLIGTRWRVETVADGVTALEVIARDPPALLLADVMMPRLDGLGLLRALRAAPATQNLPVILMSARAGEESTLEGLQAGANDYLIKPFSAGDLLIRVSSQLKIAALRDSVEHEREAARVLMETLFDGAPAAIALLRGPELKIAFANPRCLELWQRSRASDVVGKPLLVALPELRGQEMGDALRQAIASGKPVFGNEAPTRLLQDGQQVVRYLNFVYVPSRDASGLLDGVSLFAFDVTREIEAREQAQLGELVGRALVSNQDIAQQLSHCCEAIVGMGTASARVWTYDEARQALDLRASAGLQVPNSATESQQLNRIATDRTAIFLNNVGTGGLVNQAWATQEGIASFAGLPLVVGDRLVGLLALYSQQPPSQGLKTAVSSTALQIAIAVDRASSARFRELFIGILGHDLRNPLNAVSMASYLLRQNATEAQLPTLARLDASTRRMVRMIEQLLDFTRARSGGGIVLRREPAELAVLCTQVVDELRTTHSDRAIELRIVGDTRGSWDTDRMGQVFSNLIANALTYASGAQPVAVRLTGTESQVVCQVHNFGPTIQPEFMPYLFDPFRRARQAKGATTQGLGLGLFICQQIVAGHGGTTTAQSTALDGTTFTVTLPKTATAS